MTRFLLFLRKIQFFILFIVLELLAFGYFYKSSAYTNAKIINASNKLVGGVYRGVSGIRSYFILKNENRRLTGQVAELQNELERYRVALQRFYADSSGVLGTDPLAAAGFETEPLYRYGSAAVVNNSIVKQHNFITIDKGLADGMEKDMALIADNGIAGYLLDCSEHFSVAMSVLNLDFRTSGKNKGDTYYGSVKWDGISYDEVTLYEVPKYADIAVGDTIVTTSFSSRFPPGVNIGTVSEFELVNGVYYEAKVKLFTSFGNLQNVNVVKYNYIEEKLELEEQVGTADEI